MSPLLEACVDHPVLELEAGDVVVRQGERSGALYVVESGAFVVTRNDEQVATIGESGTVIGEISLLLDAAHGATVTATADSRIYVVPDGLGFMSADVERAIEVARILARRLDRIDGYLVDVRTQYADSGGHLGMLDEVLAELGLDGPSTDTRQD